MINTCFFLNNNLNLCNFSIFLLIDCFYAVLLEIDLAVKDGHLVARRLISDPSNDEPLLCENGNVLGLFFGLLAKKIEL